MGLCSFRTHLVILVVLTWCTLSLAGNTSGADLLFEAGRKALAEKNYDLACQKFQESNRLEPAPGTLLNIGNCEEKRGRVASSWARYTEAMDMLGPDDPRYTFAKKTAENLEKRVPRLTVTLGKHAPAGTTLLRNGKEWKEPLGTPLRLDPQSYVILVSAPKYESATYEVTLKEGDNKELTVSPGKRSTLPLSREAGSKRKRLGFIIGGAGAAALVAGITFGVLAYNDYQTVKEECDFAAQICYNERGDKAAQRGGAFEVLAYGLSAAGTAGLTVGAYLLLHKGKTTATQLQVGQQASTSTLRLYTTF